MKPAPNPFRNVRLNVSGDGKQLKKDRECACQHGYRLHCRSDCTTTDGWSKRRRSYLSKNLPSSLAAAATDDEGGDGERPAAGWLSCLPEIGERMDQN